MTTDKTPFSTEALIDLIKHLDACDPRRIMAEEILRLRTSNEQLEAMLDAVIEAAGEDWQDVDDLPNVVKAMATIAKRRHAAPASQRQQDLQSLVSELQKPLQELKELNEGIPPMSPECFRQHAAIAALQGLLANDFGTIHSAPGVAVEYADALVQKMSSRIKDSY